MAFSPDMPKHEVRDLIEQLVYSGSARQDGGLPRPKDDRKGPPDPEGRGDAAIDAGSRRKPPSRIAERR